MKTHNIFFKKTLPMWAFSIRGNLLQTKAHCSCFHFVSSNNIFPQGKKKFASCDVCLITQKWNGLAKFHLPRWKAEKEKHPSLLLIKTKCAARGERNLSQWKKCLHVASWRRVPKVKVNKEPWIMVMLFISRLIKQLVFRCWKYCGWFISIPSRLYCWRQAFEIIHQ